MPMNDIFPTHPAARPALHAFAGARLENDGMLKAGFDGAGLAGRNAEAWADGAKGDRVGCTMDGRKDVD
ncbi:MAG: hypothetical protein IT447_15310 [Phycisphaerales bacterium]|nr:hypothetical protein [Phycisphaerales bacterium]